MRTIQDKLWALVVVLLMLAAIGFLFGMLSAHIDRQQKRLDDCRSKGGTLTHTEFKSGVFCAKVTAL